MESEYKYSYDSPIASRSRGEDYYSEAAEECKSSPGCTTPVKSRGRGAAEEESKVPPGYSTPVKAKPRVLPLNISPSDNRVANLSQELRSMVGMGKKVLQKKCDEIYGPDSPVKATSADTVPTLMRMVTFGLLEQHDGSEDDVPDVLRGELSPYKALTKPQLEVLYCRKFGTAPASNCTKNQLMTRLVKHDRRNVQEHRFDDEEAELRRQRLTKDCYEALTNPTSGMLRSAPAKAKTLFEWCDRDINHVSVDTLDQRIEFLQNFNPKFDEGFEDANELLQEERKEAIKAVWKYLRPKINSLNKQIKLNSRRADLYVRASANPDNLDVFTDCDAATVRPDRKEARPDDVDYFYSNAQNLAYFVDRAPACLRQQQCRALAEMKMKFDRCEPISEVERSSTASAQSLVDDLLRAFQVDIRSTYFNAGSPAPETTHQYLRQLRRLQGSNDLPRATIVVLPTGGGKTGVISLAGFTCNAQRVLVVVPNLEILKGMSENFCKQERTKSTFFEKSGLNTSSRSAFPEVGQHGLPKTVLLSANPSAEGLCANGDQCQAARSVAEVIDVGADIVVTNIHQLHDTNLATFPTDYFDLVIFDEGHHGASTSYRHVQHHFQDSFQLLLTATPFRSDHQGLVSLHGNDSQYKSSETTIAEAVARRIITNIVFEPVPVESFDIVSTVTREVERHVVGHEQMLAVSANKDIQHVALYSAAARESIMQTAMRRLRILRAQERHRRFHYIIGAAPTIEDAEEIMLQWRGLQAARGLKIEVVHSQHPARDRVMQDLRAGKIDVILQVNVLGEGFDLPSLSIACAFKVFRSIGPFMQFVGRVMRVQSGGDEEVIQRAYFIAHPCMRYDKHFDVFMEERQDDPTELKAKGSGVRNIDIVNHVMGDHPPDSELRKFADEDTEVQNVDFRKVFQRLFQPQRT